MNIGKSRYAMPFPTVEEIKELRYACRKVGIEGVLPETFDVTNWEDDDDYY
eukprot:CAMPEP_0202454178 /NCGR_PEP_ID=MMETSP1360-20130828/11985_1 /ASSEMBLY_ACC=CAM_ASM_000848 /TAXON_ID=515479 /ORGANISM="Licmophora paradoxa, Strain CCMP2313" /LENGTH=50 /DNA_ID=CAMNT_0049073439 /DNA_START=56 /DNA_END=208 /DNA_ORIENTATION=-